jgi:hypothetical protein
MTYGGVTCLHDRDAVERNIGALTSAWHSLNRRPHQIDLALKGRATQNINGLILRRFPRVFFANKDLR